MTEKVLVTGITGFVGSHLVEYLLSRKDVEVFGIKRWRSRMENIEHLVEKIELFDCDIRDASSIKEILYRVRPDIIFHLAAQSFVPASFNAPAETINTNIVGTLNIFEACRQLYIKPRIQVACSSEEYGLVHPDEVPINESNPLRPLSPYGVSKVGQDMLSMQYARSYDLPIIRTRAFNHTGPRRGDVFVCSSFAKQIATIENKGAEAVIHVGNLEAERDFTDVRDMVKAYWAAVEHGETGEVYNICSGTAYSMQSVLDMLCSLSKVKLEIRQDPDRLRPSDVPRLLGDCSKLQAICDWKPEIPFEKTLSDLLDYWRKRIPTR